MARGVAFTHIKNAKSQRLRKEKATGALSTEHYNAANIFILLQYESNNVKRTIRLAFTTHTHCTYVCVCACVLVCKG